jgi:hypothetical protein
MPYVRKFVPTRRQTRVSSIRKALDRLLPHDVDWACLRSTDKFALFGQLVCTPALSGANLGRLI